MLPALADQQKPSENTISPNNTTQDPGDQMRTKVVSQVSSTHKSDTDSASPSNKEERTAPNRTRNQAHEDEDMDLSQREQNRHTPSTNPEFIPLPESETEEEEEEVQSTIPPDIETNTEQRPVIDNHSSFKTSYTDVIPESSDPPRRGSCTPQSFVSEVQECQVNTRSNYIWNFAPWDAVALNDKEKTPNRTATTSGSLPSTSAATSEEVQSKSYVWNRPLNPHKSKRTETTKEKQDEVLTATKRINRSTELSHQYLSTLGVEAIPEVATKRGLIIPIFYSQNTPAEEDILGFTQPEIVTPNSLVDDGST
ncbi:hypothetical protein KC19_VG089400 [Ceratodon purpureus]|uniref:Uncharacterized protein n=1 Tax=Ceratodon purpureus TaxID=3225 RepID=A0A8T0HNI8_CERPU|nr:hypothetical protein KC19_VG089400 [Ceratodon purpureus]